MVTTTFWPRVLETDATTGPLTPFSKKALLNALRAARGEKSFVELGDLIKISRLEVFAFFSGLTLLARVHSWGVLDLVKLLLATLAKEGVELIELVELRALVELIELVELSELVERFKLAKLFKLVELVDLVELVQLVALIQLVALVRALALNSI